MARRRRGRRPRGRDGGSPRRTRARAAWRGGGLRPRQHGKDPFPRRSRCRRGRGPFRVREHGEGTRRRDARGRLPARFPASPADPYALSKWRAEEALREIAARTGLPVTIVRIPLTYGPGVGGNFRALVRLADSGAWLPFATLRNRRSFVHVDDLAQALLLAATHPRAPGRAYLAAHPVPVATVDLVRTLRAALGRPARLFASPAFLLESTATLVGMGDRMRRLTRPLEADPQALMDELGWSPRVDIATGIPGTVAAFRAAGGP
ncbi:MAG: NAD-dependent epimerase/dehydratase family protein [Betaproteobacteria bacterium]|nr:NAD-dependent epimerase/dehydratase family protein [Betaproteobacteria bacterium]